MTVIQRNAGNTLGLILFFPHENMKKNAEGIKILHALLSFLCQSTIPLLKFIYLF